MPGEEPRHCHRGNTRVALEHLDQRVLHREPEHAPTLLAQDIGDRFEDRALACARDALDRDDAVVRAKQQTPCPFLSSVQGQAIFDLGQGLQTGPGKVGRNNRRRSAAPVFDPGNDALFEADSIACREQFPVGVPALLQMSLAE